MQDSDQQIADAKRHAMGVLEPMFGPDVWRGAERSCMPPIGCLPSTGATAPYPDTEILRNHQRRLERVPLRLCGNLVAPDVVLAYEDLEHDPSGDGQAVCLGNHARDSSDERRDERL